MLAAEFTNGSKARPAQVAITEIANGRRRTISTHQVDGKREARAIAAHFNAKPWNF
jgi:hypothetical protein